MELAAVAAVLVLIATARNRRQRNEQPDPEPPADATAPRRRAPSVQPSLSIDLPTPDLPDVSVPDVGRYAQRGFSEASRAVADAAPDVSRYAAAGFSTLADAVPRTPDVSRYAAAGFSTLADAVPRTPDVSRYGQRGFSYLANALPPTPDVPTAPSVGNVVGILTGPVSSAFNAAAMSRTIGESVNKLMGWNTRKRDWRRRAVRKLGEAIDAGTLTGINDMWANDGRWVSAFVGAFAGDRQGGSWQLTVDALSEEVRKRLNVNLSDELRQALLYDLATWGVEKMERMDAAGAAYRAGREAPPTVPVPERIELWDRLLFQVEETGNRR